MGAELFIILMNRRHGHDHDAAIKNAPGADWGDLSHFQTRSYYPVA